MTGPAGAGKTSLCERIAHSAGLSLRTVLLGSGRFDEPSAILQAVLFELEEPFEGSHFRNCVFVCSGSPVSCARRTMDFS